MELMIDCETLSTDPTAVVPQIGWALFDDKNVYDPVTLHMDIQQQIDMGRRIDASTLRWWMVEQPKEAQLSVFNPPDGLPFNIAEVRDKLQSTILSHQIECIWSHGPHFDMAILRSLLGEGAYHYRAPRDTRTLQDLAPHAKKPKPKIKHDAGHDAYAQALWVQNMKREIQTRMMGGLS